MSAGEACKTASLASLVVHIRSAIDQEDTETSLHRFQHVKKLTSEDVDLALRVIFASTLSTVDNNTFAMHADMVKALRSQCPEFPPEPECQKSCTFLRLLWNICQDDFQSLRRSLGQGGEARSPEVSQSVVTLRSTKLESGCWKLTCTTMTGTNLLPDLVMPKDYRYEDVRVMLAKVTGIASCRVKLVSPAGDLLTDDREGRLPALMKFFGHLFNRQLLSKRVIGQVTHELIGIRDGLPTECEVLSACTLCEVIGSNMDSTAQGRKLMSQFCHRLIDIKSSVSASGKLYLSDELRSRVQGLLNLRISDWRGHAQ